MTVTPPALPDIHALQAVLRRWLIKTPVMRCQALEELSGARVFAKLEFLQRTATFKPRGALSVLLSLDDAQKAAGVTAVSAGNHAIAVAFAARETGTHAKVVMTRSSSPQRVARCKDYGAEVVLADNPHAAFELAEQIGRDEQRYFVHPFEGPLTTLGTATLGAEICEQVDDFDALLVPIGGGGLCSGVAAAVKQLRPEVEIFGIEPLGADSMHRSFLAGKPVGLDRVDSIADSLGAPFALPYSFEVCRQFVDQLVHVSDDQLRAAMTCLFMEMKLAVEPACAASTAALLGPLAKSMRGRKVVLVMCGSNTDWLTWERHSGMSNAA